MKNITVQAFDVRELDGKAKEKALNWLTECATDYEWYDLLLEEWKAKLADLGYIDADIKFSGFWSQGDGASFTATVDLGAWIKQAKSRHQYAELDADCGVTASIGRLSSHYVHENTIAAELGIEFSDTTDDQNALLSKLESALTEDARELSKEIYRDLEKAYESITSEDALLETADANEFVFDKYGAPVHHLEA